MVYNTGGRFQLDKPAPEAIGPATIGRPQILGWGTARKAGASGEPGTAGEGPRGSPAKLFVAVVGWGRWERRAPPRLARLLGLRQLVVGVCWCPYCVRLCMICAPVFPSSHPWHPQITRRLCTCTGNGLSCVVRHGAGKNFPRPHSLVVPVSWRSAAGGTENAEKAVGHLGNVLGTLRRGRGPPPDGLHNLFFYMSFSLFSLCAKRFLSSHSFAKPSRLYG